MEHLHTQALNYAGALETDPIIESMMQTQARHILVSDPEWVGFSVLFPEHVALCRRKPVQVFVDEIEQYRNTMKARHFYAADEYILPDDMDVIASEIIRRGWMISITMCWENRPTIILRTA